MISLLRVACIVVLLSTLGLCEDQREATPFFVQPFGLDWKPERIDAFEGVWKSSQGTFLHIHTSGKPGRLVAMMVGFDPAERKFNSQSLEIELKSVGDHKLAFCRLESLEHWFVIAVSIDDHERFSLRRTTSVFTKSLSNWTLSTVQDSASTSINVYAKEDPAMGLQSILSSNKFDELFSAAEMLTKM